MNEIYQKAEEFLNAIFDGLGLEARASASAIEGGCLINIDGPDASLLRSEGGELLEAINHLVTQAFSRSLSDGERIVCDAQGFRAEREAELRVMAHHAAERVRATGVPFTFGPMTASERRVIHLALADDESLLTESVGEGNARRLKVSRKSPGR